MLVIRRKPAYADKARSYQIELDGNIIGEVKDGETKKINIAPDEHMLKLKIDWTSSPSLKFSVKDKEDVQFLCKSTLTGSKIWLSIFYVIFAPHKYIYLEQVSK